MSGVDWDRMNELRNDIGEEDFADVAILFVAELRDSLGALGPETATAADFHFLRGSAANLGFVAMVDACTRAELACGEGRLPDVAAVRRAFEDAMREVAPRVPELGRAA